jgi:hypothetical protein
MSLNLGYSLERIEQAHVVALGVENLMDVIVDLVECGCQRFTLFHRDWTEERKHERKRQGLGPADDADLSYFLKRLTRCFPGLSVKFIKSAEFADLSLLECRECIGDADLFVISPGNRAAVWSKANQIALTLGIPTVCVLVHADREGKVLWWTPENTSCLRCLVPEYFQVRKPSSPKGTHDGGLARVDFALTNAVAEQICLGVLSRGTADRFGTLLDALGDRQTLVVQNGPACTPHTEGQMRGWLGVAKDCDAYSGWQVAALRDPQRGEAPCPDCREFRGVRFVEGRDSKGRVLTFRCKNPA